VLHAQGHAGEVDVDDAVPLLGGQSASGVCDCSTPALSNATSSRPNVSTVRSSAARTSSSLVTSQCRASARPPSFDQPGRLADVGLRDAGNGDGGALGGEGQGGGPADAPTGAGDERDLAGAAAAFCSCYRVFFSVRASVG
jgi:hypothetical protein